MLASFRSRFVDSRALGSCRKLTTCAQDIVNGLDSVLYNDLMSNLGWLFSVHDNDNDGYLTKDEVLQLSESLLVSSSPPRCHGRC